jgi:hypothetical protein
MPALAGQIPAVADELQSPRIALAFGVVIVTDGLAGGKISPKVFVY